MPLSVVLVESSSKLTYSALIRCLCAVNRETIFIAALSPAQSFSGRPRGSRIGRCSMILSGSEIKVRLGHDIRIDPFNDDQLNPNSYNLRLHDELLVYEEIVLDMKRPNRFRRLTIPPEGIVLQPNQMYLGRTIEYTETRNLVPMLEGRSSIGRLGMFVHVTAGFGDVGFCGYWTLEMIAIQPIRIYPGVQVCQVFYHTVEGAITEYHSGKYQNNKDIQPSFLYRELEKKDDRQKILDFEAAKAAAAAAE